MRMGRSKYLMNEFDPSYCEPTTRQCPECSHVLPKTRDYFYYTRGHASGYCKDCTKLRMRRWEENNRDRVRERQRKWRRNNIELSRKRSTASRQKLKTKILDAYGRKCTCCGEAEPLFLTLEHLNGDGAAHRKARRGYGTYRDVVMLGFPAERYTILCFNCNSAKARNRGICPHTVLNGHVIGRVF